MLYRAKKITSNFKEELLLIKRKLIAANHPIKFIESFIRTFRRKDSVDTEEFIIPNLFEVSKSVILLEISFSPENETSYKQFIEKFYQFTNNTFNARINWLTRKMRTLFQLKDKSLHPSDKSYKRICSCSEPYVGESIRIVEARCSEHNDSRNKSNPSRHLN